MSNLKEIAHRHLGDRWKDALFIGIAVLLTALSVGSVTSKARGTPSPNHWSVTLVDSNSQPIVR
jgi:hypothetical protein